MALKPKLECILSSCAKKIHEMTTQEKAICIHDYVRDVVKFGFNKDFDQTSSLDTISAERGHCNPKGRLFVNLLKEAGIKARQHFVNIPKFVLRNAIPTYEKMPEIITHSFAEVNFSDDNDKWIKVDSYVVDKTMFEISEKLLEEDVKNGVIDPSIPGQGGYGIVIGGSFTWDGQSDSFSQFDPRSSCFDFVDENGIPLTEDQVFVSPQYKHAMAQRFIYWTSRLTFGAINKYLNRDADAIRCNSVQPK